MQLKRVAVAAGTLGEGRRAGAFGRGILGHSRLLFNATVSFLFVSAIWPPSPRRARSSSRDRPTSRETRKRPRLPNSLRKHVLPSDADLPPASSRAHPTRRCPRRLETQSFSSDLPCSVFFEGGNETRWLLFCACVRGCAPSERRLVIAWRYETPTCMPGWPWMLCATLSLKKHAPYTFARDASFFSHPPQRRTSPQKSKNCRCQFGREGREKSRERGGGGRAGGLAASTPSCR